MIEPWIFTPKKLLLHDFTNSHDPIILFEGAVPVLFGYCYTGIDGPYPRIMWSRKNPIVTPSFSPQLQGQFPAYTSIFHTYTSIIHTYPYPLLVYTQYISVLYIAINIINPSNYMEL